MIERIVSRGLDAPAKFAPTLKVRKGNARYRKGQQRRKGESAYNPWTQYQSKELIYLLQKFRSHQKIQVLCACSQGDRLVVKDHRSSPTATHKDAQARYTSCFKFVTQLYPYVHATGLATSTLVFLKFTIINQHDFDIITSISQNNYQASNLSQYSIYSKESFTCLEH